MTTAPLALTTATFEDALAGAGTQPFLADFWVQGCGPCKALAPVLAEAAAEQADRLTVGMVQLEHAPELAARYEIMALPTLIVFVGGLEKTRLTGASTKAELLAELEEFLA
ncbi:thioredoxin family protein [Nonomuraea turcica]|uniref:thioredoxin family protein n=1 Tax=Nonomuraea sp. G32 TaxID=3067274 RepID=UPI00273C20A9|nr:thioredoxin domain-containing protein [Nonomuraea sp. G32]MDP4510526.1 thioredoxin domain-containing protein [Nonomuraea sp. G32]